MREHDLYVKDTGKTGRGLFTKKPIKKGEIAFIMRGKVEERHYRDKWESLREPDMVGIGKNKWIDPRPPYKYLNHSCEPNTGIRGKVTFRALRDIKADEELTFDYSTSEDSLWDMECECNKKGCRRVIRGIRYLPHNEFKRLEPHTPEYFKKVYYAEKKKKNNG